MSAINGMGNPSVYPNYVYNTNKVSAQSLNKIQGLPQDGTKSRVNVYSNSLNQNPLKPGQTQNYGAVVESQQSQSDRNASRLMSDSTQQAQSASSQKDPAQDQSMNITQITAALNEKSAPNADIMKTPDPAEEAARKLTEPPKSDIEKSPSERISEMNTESVQGPQSKDPSQNPNMSISEISSVMNQGAVQNPVNVDPAADPNQSGAASNKPAIPNVSL